MFTILNIVYTRPDVSSRQLPPYSNSGKLLTTDSFAHAYQHATAIIQTIKLYRAHSTLSWHQLWPRGEPHVLTPSRDALASACEQVITPVDCDSLHNNLVHRLHCRNLLTFCCSSFTMIAAQQMRPVCLSITFTRFVIVKFAFIIGCRPNGFVFLVQMFARRLTDIE